MPNIDELKIELENLVKLHVDLEKQMLSFDEVVPYERQRTAQIYSPRLLNMMLVCGVQVESITKLVLRRCNLDNHDGIRPSIQKINKKAVLSNFNIISIPHRLQFTPFTRDLEWWESYNELKHELKEKQFKLTYSTVMDAFAALAALHCLTDKLIINGDDMIPKILDAKYWTYNQNMYEVTKYNIKTGRFPTNVIYQSLLFEIRNVGTFG
jgi:hypothetical protein